MWKSFYISLLYTAMVKPCKAPPLSVIHFLEQYVLFPPLGFYSPLYMLQSSCCEKPMFSFSRRIINAVSGQ